MIFPHFRLVWKSRSSFVINIIGLSTGVAGVLLIALWVSREWSVDRFHENNDRLFQVMENDRQPDGVRTSGQTADFLAQAMAGEFPEIDRAVVTTPANFFPAFSLGSADRHINGVGKFVGPEYLSLFSFPLVAGNPARVLEVSNSVLLSESMARRLFGSVEAALAKPMRWQIANISRDVVVTGVFQDVPNSSSESFDLLLTFDSFREVMAIDKTSVNWENSAPFHTYVTLRKGADVGALQRKLADWLGSKSKNAATRHLFLKPYADNYLYGAYDNGKVVGGRIDYVHLFSLIAFFILITVCINFINLSTAHALGRMKEVGVRKAIGATRSTLFFHYFKESLILTVLSVIAGVLLVYLLLPAIGPVLGIAGNTQFKTIWITVLFAVTLITAILAGGYPAWYLSGFRPSLALRGQLASTANRSSLRKVLVIFQFVISTVLVAGVWVVHKQIEFIQSRHLGYNKDHVLYFEAQGKVNANAPAFLGELQNVPGVDVASSMFGNIISQEGNGGMPGKVTINGKEITVNSSGVNVGLIELLGMKMKYGRSFSKDMAGDADKVIYNEAAVEAFGIHDPVGKTVGGHEILGVVKNFHFQSMHEPIKPYSFRLEPEFANSILVRVDPASEKQVMEKIQKLHSRFNPGYPLEIHFLDQDYQLQFQRERRVANLAQYFAALATALSCLGLLGLVSHATARRQKEIGIRKVLGSREWQIIWLLGKSFSMTVLAAVLLALPISYFVVQRWLDPFYYHVDLSVWFFAGAGGVMMGITWLTVFIQTIRAAQVNPVDHLRLE